MRVLKSAAVALMFLALTSCSDSTEPKTTEEPTYPDIPGLVVFYQFDGNLENETSSEHNASASSEVTYIEDHNGTANSAVTVVTEEISVPDHSDLDITGSITLAAWVKPGFSNRAYNAVIDKNYTDAYSLGMHGALAVGDTYLRSYISDVDFETTEIVPIGSDTWSHIVFTFDGATGTGTL